MNPEFSKDWVAAQRALRPVRKNAKNPHFKSEFADLGEVTDAAKEALNSNNIAFTQESHPQLSPSESLLGLVVVTSFIHGPTGEIYKSHCFIGAKGGSPQDIGAATTYGRRYGLSEAMGIVADKDDDAESIERKPPQAAKPADHPAVAIVRDAFWPTTEQGWGERIAALKTRADCKTAKEALVSWLQGDVSHPLYKALETRYKESAA